jgi:hypothetical protein
LPCFWHHRIEAGDLGSHTYNAWLAQLIARGQAPGLFIVRQWNNVLADVMLTRLGSMVGVLVAEKIVVSVSVLVFFWGAFALIQAASGRSPWYLVPALAMIAYGWTFQMGFLNYYLSLGLAFLAVALLWKAGRPSIWFLALVLGFPALLAHPIGFLWLVGTVAYVKFRAAMDERAGTMLFAIALLVILCVHFYVSHRYRTFSPVGRSFYLFTGPDQLVVYGRRYRVLALAFLMISTAIAALGILAESRRVEFWSKLRIPLELSLLAVFATALLWGGISIPNYSMGVAFLSQRVSSITAVLLLCLLGCMQPRVWHLIALLGCAVAFFSFLYQDTGIINQMEAHAESLLAALPPGTRVIATLSPFPGWRVGVDHTFDRACIGRCFAYSNYEPSTGQFRVRVRPGSRVVVAGADVGLAMREGRYHVKAEDLPLFELYQCNEKDPTQLCLRPLNAGEDNGRLGYHLNY